MTELEENGDLDHEASTDVSSGESDSDTSAELPLRAIGNDLRMRAKNLETEGLLKLKFSLSCLSALEGLLHDVYVVYQPSTAEYSQRGDLVRYYDAMAREVYGKRKAFVEAYGSYLMNMFSHTSDLDLSINFSSASIELPRAVKIKALRKFSKKLYHLQSKGRISGVSPIMSARVPILKFVDCGTGIECDISVENKDGILKSHFVAIVSEIDERFQKLCSLMKAWANVHGINSSKDGTLNSLSIILLVALHLQTRDPPILPPFSALLKDGTSPGIVKEVAKDYLQFGKENKESLAILFTSLLSKLASIEVLWREGLCASAYDGSWISKKWKSKIGNISVEDFMDPSQNVARAVRREEAKAIYKCINSSLHQLSEFLEGRIEVPELKLLLFGAEPVPPQAKGMKIGKRIKQRKKKQKKAALLDSILATESSQKEGSSSEGGVQTAAAIQNQSPESLPDVKNPKRNKKKRSEKATPPSPVSKKKARQTVAAIQNHSLSLTAHSPPGKLSYVIPELGHGFQNQTLDTIQNHMPPMVAPIPRERPPFSVPGYVHEFQKFSTGLGFNEVGVPNRGPVFNDGQWERHHTGPAFQNHPLPAPVLAEKPPFVIPRFGHDLHKFPTGVREPVEYNGVWDLRHPMYPRTNVGEQWGGHPAIQNYPHPISAPIGYNGVSDSRGPLYPRTNGGEQWGGHQPGPIFQNPPHPISSPVDYNGALDFQRGPVLATRNVGGQYGGQQNGSIFHNHPLPVSAPVGYNEALDSQHGLISATSNGGGQYGGQQAGLTFQNDPPPIFAPAGHNGAMDSQPGLVSATSNGGGQYGGEQSGLVQNDQLPVSAPVGSKGAWIPQQGGAGVPQQGSMASTSNDAAKYRGDQRGHVVQNHPLPSSAPVGSNGAWSSQQGTVSSSKGDGQFGGAQTVLVAQTPLGPDSVPVACNGVWVSQRGPVSTSNESRHEAHQTRPVVKNAPLPSSVPIRPSKLPSAIPGVGHGIQKIPTGVTTNTGGHWHCLGS